MPVLNFSRRVGFFLPACTSILLLASISAFAQTRPGILKGKIIDGASHATLYNVAVAGDSTSAGDTSTSDGQYRLMLNAGTHTLSFSHEGFQTKVIPGVMIRADETSWLDIVLYPINVNPSYKLLFPTDNAFDRLSQKDIRPGTDKDGAQLLRRLHGVVIDNKGGSDALSSLNISGFGDRFNQVLLNGAPMTSFDPTHRAYALDLIPVEAIEEVAVHTSGDPSRPADYVGGTASVQTKDMPDQDFFYVRAGAGFSDATNGKDFYSDKQGSFEWLGLPGAIRDLPGSVPSTWNSIPFNKLNPQQKAYVSKNLKNNLAPINHGSARPNDKIVLGLGRLFKLRNGGRFGVLAYIGQQHSERIDQAVVQVAPDVTSNPYPFTDPGKVLIRTSANDLRYHYSSHLSAVLNAAILYGRNKISFKSLVGRQFSNTYTRRSQLYNQEEDSLAHTGLNYLAEEATIIQPQFSGEHALGGDGKFKLTWLASYAYYHRRSPDERNFMLRQDSIDRNLYEIAHPLMVTGRLPNDFTATARSLQVDFTNSGRRWTDVSDHNFNGGLNISVPFHLWKRTQTLSGGAGIQSRYRILSTDFLRVMDAAHGYYTLDKLLSPERYLPGGLSVYHYFNNGLTNSGINNPPSQQYHFQDEGYWGDYVASSNLGSAYIKLEGAVSDYLSFNIGGRLESYGQLVSNSINSYNPGFKYPEQLTINKNSINGKTVFLPSLYLSSRPIAPLRLHAAFFRTVNRAQLQELSFYRYYDANSFIISAGNPLLDNTTIDNYEAGIDGLFGASGHLSVTGFFKRMDQPIENILFRYSDVTFNHLLSTPYNTPPTDVKGLSASFRTGLDFIADADWLKSFSFFAGGTWQKADVPNGPIRTGATPFLAAHSLSGSPDYTVNAGMVLQYPRIPSLTVLYQRTADYISAVGSAPTIHLEDNHSVSTVPDYRVKGRDQLDIQVSQKFFRSRIELVAGVNNLTNSAYIEYQDLNGNKKFDKPLSLTYKNNSGGYFAGGVDNTVLSIKPQRTYYLTVSYLFH